MTIEQIHQNPKDRWQHKPIPRTQVELISEKRLHTPLTGEKILKQCNASELTA